MEIYLIRHTQVTVAKNSCYGQFDVTLANTFLTEADALKSKLPQNFDKVFSSTATRCKLLAQHLTPNQIEFSKQLLEVNFGDWENKPWNEIDQTELNHWMQDFVNQKPPNGENLVQLFNRVQDYLNNLRKQKHQKVLICTHAGVIRCIWAYLLNIPLVNIFKIPVAYGEIFIFNLAETANLDSIKQIK